MNDYLIKNTTLKAIADALRGRGFLNNILTEKFSTKINQLPPLSIYRHKEIEYDDDKASEIVAVAQSYLDAIADGRLVIIYKAGYSALSGANQKLKNDAGVYCIQCSAFVGLILRGIRYEDSPYYDGDGSKVEARTDLYTWANSDYQNAGVTEANQLALYAYQNGCILNSNAVEDIKKGDILFWTKDDNVNFAGIWHVGLALEDGGKTVAHALNGRSSGIWTFDMSSPPNILGELMYIARPRYNVVFENEKALKILEQPKDYTGVAGDTAIYKVVAQGEGLTYKWQYCKSNNTNWFDSTFEGFDTDTQAVGVASYRNGDKYRCVITDKYGNTVTSNVVILYCTS